MSCVAESEWKSARSPRLLPLTSEFVGTRFRIPPQYRESDGGADRRLAAASPATDLAATCYLKGPGLTVTTARRLQPRYRKQALALLRFEAIQLGAFSGSLPERPLRPGWSACVAALATWPRPNSVCQINATSSDSRPQPCRGIRGVQLAHSNSSSSIFADLKSGVSKPSVNQRQIGASR